MPTTDAIITTGIRIPVETHERLRKIAFETRVSLNALMIELIHLGLDLMLPPQAVDAVSQDANGSGGGLSEDSSDAE